MWLNVAKLGVIIIVIIIITIIIIIIIIIVYFGHFTKSTIDSKSSFLIKSYIIPVLKKKSRIRETPNLSTDADSSTAVKKLLSFFFFLPPPSLFKKKNFTFIKSHFVNNFGFFTNKCTHLLITSNFGPQGPQNAAFQQRYSPCQSKNPISAEKLKTTFATIQILP